MHEHGGLRREGVGRASEVETRNHSVGCEFREGSLLASHHPDAPFAVPTTRAGQMLQEMTPTQ